MGQAFTLDTPTGRIGGWRAEPPGPPGPPRGALLVVQEIFGVNRHIRSVADGFAAHGYRTFAPAFFDHFEAGVELDYDESGVARGRALVAQLGFERALEDLRALAAACAAPGRTAVLGFCWGGTVAFLANARLGLPAVSYYGGRSMPYLHEPLQAPMLFHFGERDPIIPPEHVAAHRAAQPDAEVHVYPAGHGFNCEARADYHAPSAELALQRTLEFLARHLP